MLKFYIKSILYLGDPGIGGGWDHFPYHCSNSVTKHGETLYPILEAMCDWGYDNIGDRYELIHPACPFEAEKA